MARPLKCRKICSMPENKRFGPLSAMNNRDIIVMTLDEFETIRLIDHMGLNQEDSAKQMNVARTTIQSIYNSARKKIAKSLVDGHELFIEGGEYILCEGNHKGCCTKCHCKKNNQASKEIDQQ